MPAKIAIAREKILAALIYCKGRRGDAARLLGISVATLRRRCHANLSIESDLLDIADFSHRHADMITESIPSTFLHMRSAEIEYRQLFETGRPRRLNEEEIQRFLDRAFKRKRKSAQGKPVRL